jgi:protein involved in polysaccharide export with SLBB domain
MTKQFSLFLLLSCALCAGQSTVTTPGAPAPLPVLTGEEDAPAQALPAIPRANKGNPVAQKGALPEKVKVEEDDEAATPEPAKKILPITVPSDFERFVEDAVGHRLMVYGRTYFDDAPTTFSPLDRIPVPADYAIGPGDELLIRAWGKIDIDVKVTVDRNGQISLPKVGTFNVAGLRYEQLDGYLRSAISSIYKGFELNVTMGRLRAIQIFVLGSARQPGAYTISSLSTLLDALFASGGPSASGTMRHIQLRRGGRQITEMDLYDVLRKGDKSRDVQLLPGDVIYIPAIGPQVAIDGSVNEPGIIELKDDTNIAAALEDVGGLTNLAATSRVLLELIEDHKNHHVDGFTLDAGGLRRLLRDGDLLKISPISSQFEDAVILRGNVASPGRFPWHQGMRVSDLIPSRGALVTNEHWKQQNHLADARHTDIMTDIAESNAEINWEYAVIARLDERDLSTRLIPFNLGNAIDNPASADNQPLKSGDVLSVFARKDIPLPMEKHQLIVQVGGEVNAPGVYRVNPGDTLREVVERAGGMTKKSYLYALQLTRLSTLKIQEEQLRQSIDQMQKDLFSHYANAQNTDAIQGTTGKAGEEQAQFGMQRAMIGKLAAIKPTGRVVLGIKTNAKALAEIPEFPLEDGDSIYIPPQLGTIQVTGEVYNANALRYQAHKRLFDYLNDTGGPTRTADVKRIFLIRADGTVVSRQRRSNHWAGNFEKITLMPGDAIIVPPKTKTPGGFLEELSMITQMASQTAMTSAVISLLH